MSILYVSDMLKNTDIVIDIDENASIEAPKTYEYNGIRLGKVFLNGNPLGPDIRSTYDDVRLEIPLDVIDTGKGGMNLPSNKVKLLSDEGRPLEMRAAYFLNPLNPLSPLDPGGASPGRAMSDVDQLIRIQHTIKTNAKHNTFRKKAGEMVDVLGLRSDIVLSLCALNERNYVYAQELLIKVDNDLTRYDINDAGIALESLVYLDKAISMIVAAMADRQGLGFSYPQDIHEQLGGLSLIYQDLEDKDEGQHFDLIPADAPLEESYFGLIDANDEVEAYENAGVLKKEMERIGANLKESGASPFVQWAGKNMLFSMVPAGTKYKANGNMIIADVAKGDRGGKGHYSLVLLGNGKNSSSFAFQSDYAEQMQPHASRVALSSPYVLRTKNRWDTAVNIFEGVPGTSDTNYLLKGYRR